MSTVVLHRFEEAFVIHFGGDFTRINAYTLASTLVGFADAAKAANAIINPGYEVEVVVEAIGPGSFKARVRTLYHGAANLFSKENIRAVVLGVIAAYVYQHTLAPHHEVKVTVGETDVVVQQGDTRIIVPKHVYEATKAAEESREFRNGISRAFDAIDSDDTVRSFGFSSRMEDEEPEVPIPRSRFPLLSSRTVYEDRDSREIVETTELQITRAILERSRRKWQFAWRGIRISAPVCDDRFYDDFFAHNITIAPGDSLEVRLRIKQRRDADSGVLINDPNGYEVLEVIRHIPRARQVRVEE